MTTLIIVESPSKAKTIQTYAGSGYKVVACRGHICDLGKGRKHGIGIDIEHDFRPRYVILEDQIQTLEYLTEEAKKSDCILLCSDEDREGEAISYHLQSRLGDLGKPMKRITMNEITKKGVAQALKNPRDIDMQLVHSQEARRILDRLVGFLASPFLMRYFGNNLSAGRVQSVVARMIVDREKEIEEFKSEEYWVIQARLANDKQQSFTAKYEGKVNTREDAQKVKDELTMARFLVKGIEAAEEKKKAPPPLITAKLQQVMSKSHGISAERTMKAAQSLYEHSFITYMRTDSVRANTDALTDARAWLKINGHDIPKSANQHTNKDAAQDAHECIRPTNIDMSENASFAPDEAAVYDVIRKYFLASQMMPAVYSTLKVIIATNDTQHTLKAGGKALKTQGYLAMFGADVGSIDMPNLVAKERVVLFGKDPITTEQKFTQPPARYSEAHLIETLEKKNIGRPSTFAELVAKITARNYVERRGNVFYPTDLGKKIINELISHFSFMDLGYTASMEEKLDLIAGGTLDHVKMLKEFYAPFRTELNSAYTHHGAPACEKCGSPMIERAGKTATFLGCTRYPSCWFSKPLAATMETSNDRNN